jgi:hypothetical protein
VGDGGVKRTLCPRCTPLQALNLWSDLNLCNFGLPPVSSSPMVQAKLQMSADVVGSAPAMISGASY